MIMTWRLEDREVERAGNGLSKTGDCRLCIVIPCRSKVRQLSPQRKILHFTAIVRSFHTVVVFQSLTEPPVQEKHVNLSGNANRNPSVSNPSDIISTNSNT
jgi:hypothetical protein